MSLLFGCCKTFFRLTVSRISWRIENKQGQFWRFSKLESPFSNTSSSARILLFYIWTGNVHWSMILDDYEQVSPYQLNSSETQAILEENILFIYAKWIKTMKKSNKDVVLVRNYQRHYQVLFDCDANPVWVDINSNTVATDPSRLATKDLLGWSCAWSSTIYYQFTRVTCSYLHKLNHIWMASLYGGVSLTIYRVVWVNHWHNEGYSHWDFDYDVPENDTNVEFRSFTSVFVPNQKNHYFGNDIFSWNSDLF